MCADFVNYHTLEKRQAIANRIRQVYPDRIAIIVNRLTDDTPAISKFKYLVSMHLSFDNFANSIREYIGSINSQQALFFFVNGTTLISNDTLLSTIYDKYKADDGFLYITYAVENTYG